MPDLRGILQLAKTYLAAGQFAKAVPLLEQAVRMQPKNAVLYLALGEARQSAGQTKPALDAYNRCIKLNPASVDAWCRLAALHQQLKEPELAATAYKQALNLAPAFAEVATNLGIVLLELGRNTEAAEAFRHALAHKPQLAEAKNGLGVTLLNEGNYVDAITIFKEAIALRPQYAEALFNQGAALQASGRWAEAVAVYRQIQDAGKLAPTVLNNLGLTLWHLHDFSEATKAHRQAIALRPDYAEAHLNLGNDLLSLFHFDEAAAAYERALQCRPDYPAVLHNLGNVFLAQNRIDEAIQAYRRAAADTFFPEAEYSESMALLLKGDFANGLPKYEHRWALKLAGLQPGDFTSPLWQGEAPAGRTILLYSEQGLGDTLQFARYAPDVAKRGAKVVLYVHPPLKDLLSSLPGIDRVVSLNEPIPPHDLRCPLLSLPLAFKTDLSSIPAKIPYLEAPLEKIGLWRNRFAARAGLKIGIVCSGSTQHHNDHNRSIPLTAFKPLAEAAGGPLYLIQKEVRPDDEITLANSPELISLASEINNFSDTAAIIANLDLVIAVDTSIVHLVGAMGKPIWTLLAFPPDWRWMLDRADSPWYPSMRLFRQPAAGDWSTVLAQVTQELRTFRQNFQGV